VDYTGTAAAPTGLLLSDAGCLATSGGLTTEHGGI
jgi:hypothetical protein